MASVCRVFILLLIETFMYFFFVVNTMEKRGQLFSAPYMAIFTVVVIALIFGFGAYLIYQFTSFSKGVELTTAVTDLQNVVNRYDAFERGSSYDLTKGPFFPNTITEVCFTNPQQTFLQVKDQNLQFLFENSPNHNMFLVPLDVSDQTRFKIDFLQPSTNPLCVLVKNGALQARLESKGTHVEILKL